MRCHKKHRNRSNSDDESSDEEDDSCSLDHHRREIVIDSEITPKLASSFRRSLLRLEGHSSWLPIRIIITSPGGCLMSGLAMADDMRQLQCRITTVVRGEVASAATIIAVSGTDEVLMYAHATFLIHQMSSAYVGKLAELNDETVNSKKAQDLVNDVYLKQCPSLSRKRLNQILADEQCFTANEAMENGFITRII
jgi:ATP-dependent Clp protease protease subunit